MSLSYPSCSSTSTKKNGHIHNGKQNHYCKQCSRQFVENREQILISNPKRQRIRKLLLERIPLRGICRVEGVSLRWLLGFITALYDQLSDDLNFQRKAEADGLIIYALESEVDEMQSFKVRKQTSSGYGWLWMYIVGRSSRSTSATEVVKVPLHFGSQYPSATGSMLCFIPMAGVRMRV